jgi:hypothetical protein
MKAAKILAVVLAVIILVLLGILVFVQPVRSPTIQQNASSTVSQAPPAVSSDGRLTVTAPLLNGAIASPLVAHGSVTGGGWFFEASFPVKVLDGDGSVLGQGTAQAESDWMTTGTVPFSTNIVFTAPHYATGTVVFSKDNPSGAPENAGELRVPVRFR